MDGRQFIWQSLVELNDSNVWDELRSKALPPKKPRASKTCDNHGRSSITTTDPNGSATPKPGMAAVASACPSPLDTTPGFRWFDHYVMNLPATAIEFLGMRCFISSSCNENQMLTVIPDAFRGLFHPHKTSISAHRLPIIHCHCFSREPDFKADVIKVSAVFTSQRSFTGTLNPYRNREWKQSLVPRLAMI